MDMAINITNTYEIVNWPKLPSHMESDLLNYSKSCSYKDNIHHRTSKASPDQYDQIQFFWFSPPTYLIDWIEKNISLDDRYTTVIQVWRYSKKFKNYGNRHKDGARDFSFNYLLEPHLGITRWFEDDGTLIDEVNYKSSVWYKHYGEKFHEVDNINSSRTAISIFEHKQWNNTK